MDLRRIIRNLIDEIRSERNTTKDWIELLTVSEKYSDAKLKAIKDNFGYREVNKVIDDWRKENIKNAQ